MKILSYLLVILLAESCATTGNTLVGYKASTNESEPADSSVTVHEEDSKYLVPKIKFDTEVSEESVSQAIDMLHKSVDMGAKAVIIEWNTPGGEVDSGFKLAKEIEDLPIPVICVVDGEAASMGMYLLQSCPVRMMTKRSTLMIHEAAMGGQVHGHEVKWRSIAESLRVSNIAIAEHISKRMFVTAAELSARIVGGLQWWLTWDEALHFGAVDQVVEDVKSVTDSYRNNMAPPDLQ